MKTTQIYPVDAQAPDAELIARAAEVIRRGGLVAFPTETVYGLGANALDAQAVRGIFLAKERPAYDPLIVHLDRAEALPQVARAIPPVAWELATHFWPGPLTLVLPRHPQIPLEVTAGGETVAVRVPAHPVAQALIRAAGVPIAAPSANRFGRVSPTRASDVWADLAGRIDLILDGGPTQVGVESTVLSLVSTPPLLLRPGGVSREALAALIGPVQLLERPVPIGERAAAPGTLLQHYAPRAQVILYRGEAPTLYATLQAEAQRWTEEGRRVGLLIAREDAEPLRSAPAVLGIAGSLADLEEVARHLFATLRALDEAGVQVILARDFGEAGLGLAIRDRLTRAAAGHVVEVTPPD